MLYFVLFDIIKLSFLHRLRALGTVFWKFDTDSRPVLANQSIKSYFIGIYNGDYEINWMRQRQHVTIATSVRFPLWIELRLLPWSENMILKRRKKKIKIKMAAVSKTIFRNDSKIIFMNMRFCFVFCWRIWKLTYFYSSRVFFSFL